MSRAGKKGQPEKLRARLPLAGVASLWKLGPHSGTFHSLPASVAVTKGAARKDVRPRGNDRRRSEDRQMVEVWD